MSNYTFYYHASSHEDYEFEEEYDIDDDCDEKYSNIDDQNDYDPYLEKSYDYIYDNQEEEIYVEEYSHSWLKGEDVYTEIEIIYGDTKTIKKYKNNVLHCDDEPAIIQTISNLQRNMYWYNIGMLHNLYGPAVDIEDEISSYYAEEYYINDIKYSKEEFENKSKEMKDELKKELTRELYNTKLMCKDICGLVAEYVI